MSKIGKPDPAANLPGEPERRVPPSEEEWDKGVHGDGRPGTTRSVSSATDKFRAMDRIRT